MKTKNLIVIALLAIVTSCSSQSEVNYANELSGCLEDSDVNMLNEACNTFEQQLKVRYEGVDLNQAYKTYIEEMQRMEVPPQFYKSKEGAQLIATIKVSQVFDKVWMDLHDIQEEEPIQIITEEGEVPPPPPPPAMTIYTMNPEGDYLKCVIDQTEDDNVKEVFQTMKELPGMSPNLTARAITMNWKDEDFAKPLNRLILCVSFYCELGLMFENVEFK